MITKIPFLEIYLYLKNHNTTYDSLTDLHFNLQNDFKKLDKNYKFTWNPFLDGIKDLERLDLIDSRKVNNSKVIFKTQKFFEVEDIYDELIKVTTRNGVKTK